MLLYYSGSVFGLLRSCLFYDSRRQFLFYGFIKGKLYLDSAEILCRIVVLVFY